MKENSLLIVSQIKLPETFHIMAFLYSNTLHNYSSTKQVEYGPK